MRTLITLAMTVAAALTCHRTANAQQVQGQIFTVSSCSPSDMVNLDSDTGTIEGALSTSGNCASCGNSSASTNIQAEMGHLKTSISAGASAPCNFILTSAAASSRVISYTITDLIFTDVSNPGSTAAIDPPPTINLVFKGKIEKAGYAFAETVVVGPNIFGRVTSQGYGQPDVGHVALANYSNDGSALVLTANAGFSSLGSPFSITLGLSSYSDMHAFLPDSGSSSATVWAELHPPIGTPVFNLPPGITANSAQWNIVNNIWTGAAPPPPPPPPDSDDDGIPDHIELALQAQYPCLDPNNADSDGDGLTDGEEINTFGTNPCSEDTDGDGLSDSEEINLQQFGCPNPLLADSDGDGLPDGLEVAFGLSPCSAGDSDNDGLSDFLEVTVYQTNPLLQDTDGDGLFDGTEVDMSQGAGCPSPRVADSDGDGLPDGVEAALGTNPCNPDTDGDGLRDDEDPDPLTPDVTPTAVVHAVRQTATAASAIPISSFDAPNANAAVGRRTSVVNKLTSAANAIDAGNYVLALNELNNLLLKIDGFANPPDWMVDGPHKTQLRQQVEMLIAYVHVLMPPQ